MNRIKQGLQETIAHAKGNEHGVRVHGSPRSPHWSGSPSAGQKVAAWVPPDQVGMYKTVAQGAATSVWCAPSMAQNE